MEFIQIISLAFVGLGLAIALLALFRKSREREPISWRDRVTGGSEQFIEINNATNALELKIEARLNEIEKSLEEFHSTAETAIAELDDKYQELMFLYTLVDEKKKEVLDIYNSTEQKPVAAKAAASKPKAADKNRSSHPRRKDILNLSKQGLSVSEIAQELNVGQDMVSLILEMGKAR